MYSYLTELFVVLLVSSLMVLLTIDLSVLLSSFKVSRVSLVVSFLTSEAMSDEVLSVLVLVVVLSVVVELELDLLILLINC